MVKVALLVGVSEYQPGLAALPSAVQDAQALQEVLQNPEMGGFDDVNVLPNPNTQQLRMAIYDLFAERSPEDLVLFYFSGHGVKDQNRNLYLATPETRKNKKGLVVEPTAVAASYLQNQMTGSRSEYLVLILDCCYSGAISKGLTAKDEGEVNIKAVLGGKGRAILTSSSSVQSSFEQEEGLSIYTQYLVEGISTGAADLNSDGRISADELHQYASEKVLEASPAMTPQFYPAREGHRIYLARSPQDDPKLKYRKEVEELARKGNGTIREIVRIYLNEFRSKWHITEDDAAKIETEVLEPYRIFKNNLNKYKETFNKAAQEQYPLSVENQEILKRFQQLFNLRDSDVEIIEAQFCKQQAPQKELGQSNVNLIPTQNKQVQVPDLIIIDKEIARVWNESPQNIRVYQNQTLASLNVKDLKSGKIIWSDVQWIEPKDLFLPELKFIDLENALPGAFLPDETQFLTLNGERITPLLPLNPILLDYFTPKDLLSKVKFTPLNGADAPLVRLTLDLPLSGIKNDQRNPQNYRIFKDYPILENNALAEVPVLEIWPHFQLEGWQEYYGFYYDAEYGKQTFQVNFPDAKEPHIFKDGRGSFQITRMDSFPSHIICQDQFRNLVGLILLNPPQKIKATSSWVVGVDFGTSFTNVYVKYRERVYPLPLESLHFKVADVQVDTRLSVLFEYFIPHNFIPLEKPLPIENFLTTRGSRTTSFNEIHPINELRPILDGRIYIPDRNGLGPQADWIHTDLSSSNLSINRLFLKNLVLLINALAGKNGVSSIQWSLSYPSNFSRRDKTIYCRLWQNITSELQTGTGITQLSPRVNDTSYFCPKTLAFAQYFADQEGGNLVSSTCIDMGDVRSSISVWEENQLVHQCSIQLGFHHLSSQILELNPNFLAQRFDFDPGNRQGLKEENFSTKLDIWLRLESDNWLKKKRYLVEEESDFQGFLRLIAIGTAGLYYYVGTILGVLYQECEYTRNEITPIYMGGNGSNLLNWLSLGGHFDRHSEINELFSCMLSKGSGFPDTEELTHLSERPGDEVACGLVLQHNKKTTKLQGLNRKGQEAVIAGEDCVVNGKLISWKDRLELNGNLQGFDIPQLEQVPNFLDEFNQAIKDLDLEGITPMEAFQSQQGLESGYRDKLWKATERELKNNLLNFKGDADNIQVEPPFILGLKALLRVLGKEWARR